MQKRSLSSKTNSPNQEQNFCIQVCFMSAYAFSITFFDLFLYIYNQNLAKVQNISIICVPINKIRYNPVLWTKSKKNRFKSRSQLYTTIGMFSFFSWVNFIQALVLKASHKHVYSYSYSEVWQIPFFFHKIPFPRNGCHTIKDCESYWIWLPTFYY